MKFEFKINPPNFAITDKGKFSIADLDGKEFTQYCDEFVNALIKNRQRIQKLKKDGNYCDVSSEDSE